MENTLDELTDSLDYYLEKHDSFFATSSSAIDSIRALVSKSQTLEEKVALTKQLGDQFRAVNIDSALVIYNNAVVLSKDLDPEALERLKSTVLKARLRRDALSPIRGIVHEAIADFEKISLDSIQRREDRKTYFQCGIELFSNISTLYPKSDLKTDYAMRASVMADSLLKYHRPHGLAYRMTNAHRWSLSGENSEAIAELIDTLYSLESKPALMASATSVIASYYETQPSKQEEYLYYLTLSAINDIKAGHREMTSLQKLGSEWFERGNLSRAYRCLTLAMSDAVASGSAARVLESSENLPLVTLAFKEYDRRFRNILITLVVILVCALILIVIMAAYLWRDKRRSERRRAKLVDQNASKDLYIQNILMLSSVFFERLEEFNLYVSRKIKANQINDLYSSVESRSYLNSQTEEFFKSFDVYFRTTHPKFMTNLNRLLLPDRRFAIPAPGESMSPEMRIAAFMRLGIDDSSILAKFLGLSLSTIYTYRNRLKNRAKNRDTFEEDVRNLEK